jgi:hypothetical protein
MHVSYEIKSETCPILSLKGDAHFSERVPFILKQDVHIVYSSLFTELGPKKSSNSILSQVESDRGGLR